MFFPDEHEMKYITRGLIPTAREQGVAQDLRGWNWNEPPLLPPYDVRMAMFEVSSKYCPTGRDLFLRHVQREGGTPNEAMIAGSMYHEILHRSITEAKLVCYRCGSDDYDRLIGELTEIVGALDVSDFEEAVAPKVSPLILDRAEILARFETNRLVARVEEVLIRQPYIQEDALVAAAIPVVMEQKMDGRFLGLSSHLSCDAYTTAEQIIMDVKFGRQRDFHRLATTGYAMVTEALYEYPVNVGAIVYGYFKNGRLIVERDYHIIDDELRQWFVEERDEKMRMLFHEQDPGMPNNCRSNCTHYELCKDE